MFCPVCQLKCEIQLAVPEFVAWDLAIYSIIVLVGFERHIIYSCDSNLCFVPETHYFNLLPMKRRQVSLSDDGRKLKRIQKEQHQKGVSVRSQHVVSAVRLHNKKQHVYLWLESLMRQWTWTVLQQ